MRPETDCIDKIAFLVRSPTRVHILAALAQDGLLDRQRLRDRFDCDRTTIQRNLDKLVSHGWVRPIEQGYRITEAGEILADALTTFADTAETAIELGAFLQWIPPDARQLDRDVLTAADITVADRNRPHGAVSQHIDALQTTDEFRGLVPSVGRHSLETVWRRVTNGEGMFEVIVTQGGAEVLRSTSEYAEMVDEILASGRVAILVTDDGIPFYLGIAADIVHIGVEDDNGMRRALLETNQDTARDWAEDTYEAYKRTAHAFEPASV